MMHLPVTRAIVAIGGMSAFYVAVLSLLGGGIDFPIEQFKTFWVYLIPLVLSYGGLVFVSTLTGPARPQRLRVALAGAVASPSPRSGRQTSLAPPVNARSIIVGTPTSAASMVACCAHHVADLVPLASVFSAASFLVQYQTWLMVGAVGLNAALIVRLAIRFKRSDLEEPQGPTL